MTGKYAPIRLPLSWPHVPEPAASRSCALCSWAWRDGSMRIKIINRACWAHSRYLGAGNGR